MEGGTCPICKTHITEDVSCSSLTERGIASLEAANEARKDEPIQFVIGQKVHNSCRSKYCHKREIRKCIEDRVEKSDSPETSEKKLRSNTSNFSFESECFFCGLSTLNSGEKVCKVENSDFKTSLLSHCSSRSDSWADSVKFHLLSVLI